MLRRDYGAVMRVMILWVCLVLLGGCGGASSARAPIELKEGERVVLPSWGATETAPVMTLKIRVMDEESGAAVLADIWLDDQQIGSGVSALDVAAAGGD